MEISWWHILIGFFFGNGMPHFLMGIAGKKFRSPLGASSSTQVNVGVLKMLADAIGEGFVVGHERVSFRSGLYQEQKA